MTLRESLSEAVHALLREQVTKLEEELADWRASLGRAEEACPDTDIEVHCACVCHLQGEIKRLREVEHSVSMVMEENASRKKRYEAAEQRVTELEALLNRTASMIDNQWYLGRVELLADLRAAGFLAEQQP